MKEQLEDLVRKSLSRGFQFTFVVHVTTMLLLYLVHIVLARTLGSAEYGIFAFVFSWLSVVALFGKFGFDLVAQRFVPDYVANGRWSLARGVLLRGFQIPTVISLLLAVVLAAGSAALVRESNPHLYHTFLLAACLIPFFVWTRMLQGAFIALKRPALAQIPEGVLQPSILLVALAAIAYLRPGGVTAPDTMFLLLWVVAITAAITTLYFRSRVMPAPLQHVAHVEFRMREWMQVALPALVISGMHLIMGYTDIIMVGWLRDTTESGIYSAAVRLAMLVNTPLAIINTVLIPFISQLYHSGQLRELQGAVSLAARLSGFLSLLAFAVLWLLAVFFLGLFGEDFVSGELAMHILMVGQLVNVLCGSVGFLMTLTGNQWSAAVVFLLAAILNVALNYVLIGHYGMVGAAVATAFSMALWNIVLAGYVRRRVGVNPTIFGRRVIHE